MAAFLAGAVRAPLTAVILLFEMTNDYHIILPLMFSVAVSLLIAQRFQRDSVYGIGWRVMASASTAAVMWTYWNPLPLGKSC